MARIWESKSEGFVSEKKDDVFTGVKTSDGEKIYEGDLIRISKNIRKYIGKIHNGISVSEKEYNNPKNWSSEERIVTGKVFYREGCFFVENIHLYPNMLSENNYLRYKIEKI